MIVVLEESMVCICVIVVVGLEDMGHIVGSKQRVMTLVQMIEEKRGKVSSVP